MKLMAVMPRAHDDWTVDDLDQLPDDGLQYELVDGVLLVSPAPRPRHQIAVGNLHLLLRAGCPHELQVFLSPVDWQPDRRNSLQPDLLVIHRDQYGEDNITVPLLLAVEVLSPSTRRKDAVLKYSKYADAGIPSYWLVDPAAPSVVAYRLVDGEYVEDARATGDEDVPLARPFQVTVNPARLLTG